MSSNVGLSTPRGSGTSGYVQRNLSLLKPRSHPYTANSKESSLDLPTHRPRKPDQAILNHDRLREIEVKVFDLRDQLEEEGVDEEEIEKREEELREKLVAEMEKGGKSGKDEGGGKRQFKQHQVHEQAEAKALESEKLRRALGIREDYEEGAHWRRKEERLREGVDGKGE